MPRRPIAAPRDERRASSSTGDAGVSGRRHIATRPFVFTGMGELADLLIAVNADPDLPRSAICHLGLTAERWFGSTSASAARLARHLGLPAAHLERALALRGRARAAAAEERQHAAALGGILVTRDQPLYPPALSDLALPPPALYVRGSLTDRPAVAIVGSRRMDPYGREAATLFARELAETGLSVVSGFAHGVDAAAHRAALAVGGGHTLAVLGTGLGVDYPRGHRRLAEEIAERGALVSEFPCGRGPQTWTFPVRNRLIAALASATLVVQAALRSGSLITAHLALELGRDVWAVPGRVFDELALGTNGLLRDGALFAQHPRDLVDALPQSVRERLRPLDDAAPGHADPRPAPAGAAGQTLAALVPGEPREVEEIAAAARLGVEAALGALLELELAGWVRRLPGPLFSRAV
jgi:DNA processing protein